MNLSDLKIKDESETDLLATSVANLFKAGINWKLLTDILCKANYGELISPPPPTTINMKKTSPPAFRKHNLSDWVRHFNENHKIIVTKGQIKKVYDYVREKDENFIGFEGEKISFCIDCSIHNLKDMFVFEHLLFKCLESYAAKPSESGDTSA